MCVFSLGTLEPQLSALLWLGMLASLAIVVAMPQHLGVRTLIIATILRLIFSVGLEPTLFLLGAFNVSVCVCVCVCLCDWKGLWSHGPVTVALVPSNTLSSVLA